LNDKHPDLRKDKFHVVTNTYDREKTSRKVGKNPEHFIICYTGIFYPDKDPYGFFRALKKWFDAMSPDEEARYRSKFQVHLIGAGDHITRQVIRSLGLEGNVVYFDRMPHEQAIEKTLAADMLLISSGTGERARPGWLPSKLFEYLGCRIPIFALIREGEMAAIIRNTNSGYVVTSEDHERIKEILKMEIDNKFNRAGASDVPGFTHVGIERFEEEAVMNNFVNIIENAAFPLSGRPKQ
jgi:glycosyltransferase involved in cell wall biosynthesis